VSVGQTGRAEKIKVFTREISGSKGVLSTKDSDRNHGNQPTAAYIRERRDQFEICVKILGGMELTMVNEPDVIRNINLQYHNQKHVEGHRAKPNRWLIGLFGKEEEKEEEQGRSRQRDIAQELQVSWYKEGIGIRTRNAAHASRASWTGDAAVVILNQWRRADNGVKIW